MGASVRGAQHAKVGKRNQDALRIHRPKGRTDPLLLAVSDGHGSERSFRSHRGAALATECAVRLLRELLEKMGPEVPWSTIRRQLQGIWAPILVAEWRRVVREDLAQNPFSALDFAAFPGRPPVASPSGELPFAGYLAYGATLIVAAVTPRHVIYAQLGDGDILMVQADGTVRRPWPREHAFRAHETISLCSDAAEAEFKVRVEPLRGAAPAVILLATDGYANCFTDDEGFFRVGGDFSRYLQESGPGFVGDHLIEWLSDSSRDGSGDDITVGLAARLSALRRCS